MRVRPAALFALGSGALGLACGPHERVPIGHDLDSVSIGDPPACAIPGLDPGQLTLLGGSDRSHWLQPWRAYRDTWPAARMTGAPGFQVRFPPDPAWLPSFTAAGFARVTMEAGWGRQTYDKPDQVSADLRASLTELARQANASGLRPLLLLDAPNTSMPSRLLNVTLTEAAAVGARSVRMSPADTQKLAVHKALFTWTMGPTLVSAIGADGVVQLSRPLRQALPAGAQQVKQLRYAPFTRPTLADGSANPEYEETLAGWLSYLEAVCGAMRDALGSQGFDVELWNETVSGNNYDVFDVNALYDPPLEADRSDSFDENLNAIRERSVRFLRAPERNLSQMGVADGSGNMRFLVTSASEPEGVTAMSRHLSAQGARFPEAADLGPTPSLDALGGPNGAASGDTWVEAFTPTYDTLFPEQSLTALYPPDSRRPAQLTRDLSPLPSDDARGQAHGRAPLVDGVPVPDVWLTAASLNLSFNETLGVTLTRADRLHVQAKTLLRMFSSYVGAGAGLISIYGPDLDTVRYFDLAQPQGGEALATLGRFFRRFAGGVAGDARSIELVSVSSCAPGRQFVGDGSDQHPDLGHRELVALFPFQRGPREFIAPVYVMTRNVLREYASGSEPERFDMPGESFQLTLRGLSSASLSATAYDPLRDTSHPVAVSTLANGDVVLGLSLFDYPVLLELSD